mmetsp:Transcript_12733/g.17162  ORF Transcript_12733/g.17162 Transcript_12733/m.17162 type:complete len:344 (+) Transcript_12733:43-1074(+)
MVRPTIQDEMRGILPQNGRVYRKRYLRDRQLLRGDCAFGQLTLKGLEQHKTLGSLYRQAYFDAGLLHDGPASEQVFVRSTDSYRTFQSAQAQLYGLFPYEGKDLDLIDIFTMDSEKENLYANSEYCPLISTIHTQRRNTSLYQKYLKVIYPIKEKIAALGYFSGDPDSVDLDGFCDYCNARKCHNFSLPPGVTEELFVSAWEADQFDNEYVWGDPDAALWSIGTFLQELVDNMKECSTQNGTKCSPAFSLFSGHDSTFYPIMPALQIFEYWYPPYASHLELELYVDSANAYFVRASTNGVEVNPYNCSNAPPGVSPLCPLEDFLSYAKEFLPPPNYFQLCGVN